MIQTRKHPLYMKYLPLSICVALLTLSGCETTPFQRSEDPPVELLEGKEDAATPTTDAGLTPAVARRFRDVPLPTGLREDTERTFVYDSKTTQVARMVYYTKKSLSDLAQFYNRRAPEEGWELLSTTQVDNSVSLLFTKAGHRLDVTISRQGVGRNNQLVLLYLPDGNQG